MSEKEHNVNQSGSRIEGDLEFTGERTKSRKNKKKWKMCRRVKAKAEQETNEASSLIGYNSESDDSMIESGKKKKFEEASTSVEVGENIVVEKGKKRKKQVLQANVADNEQHVNREGSPTGVNVLADNGNNDKRDLLLKESVEEEQAANEINLEEDKNIKPNGKTTNGLKKEKARLLEEAAKADKRGICYLSRIPPHMDHVKLRHILSQYGEIERIYLAPIASRGQVHRKRPGNQDQQFSEGWVEFTNKSTAKRVSNMLNGEQIGGRKRSQFYYDIWNVKYLSKFKWDNLTEEIAYKGAVREQKLALVLSAAKRERDFYLTKVDKSRALSSIEERLKKKQKIGKESGGEVPVEQAPKFIRQFAQTRPVEDKAQQTKSQLSKDILAGVFGGSN